MLNIIFSELFHLKTDKISRGKLNICLKYGETSLGGVGVAVSSFKEKQRNAINIFH